MTNYALIADIGGTNARFGLVDNSGVHNLQYLTCADYSGLTEAANIYLANQGGIMPSIGVFAIAGPVDEDIVKFTSLPWSFSKSRVQQDLNLKKLVVMNDFEAVALAIPPIAKEHLKKIGGPDPRPGFSKAVIGPGTGLGVASLIWGGDRYIAQAGEGGHVTVPAVDERDIAIFKELKKQHAYHHLSAERVCSGRGLVNLYNAIRTLDNKSDLPDLTAPEISEKAMRGECVVAKESLDLMLAYLGRIAGNHALTLNAQGGVYIAGGIPSKLDDGYILSSHLMEEFRAKGRMRPLMEKMPVYIVKHDAIGLLGLEAQAKYELSL